ncbi:MAG: DUF4430 domain-containing protein [Lachnospiraceae bacterium]|nr:DUF4430 domain-containing protein [Lachnospiraceae bacterium]
MSKKTKIIIVGIFVVVVLAVIGLTAGLKAGKKAAAAADTPAGGNSFTIEIRSERDNFEEKIECSSDLENLGAFIRTLDKFTYSESEYGIYVQGYDGMMEDMDNQYWWCISVNGEMASTGADEILLKNGDVYSFDLKQGW